MRTPCPSPSLAAASLALAILLTFSPAARPRAEEIVDEGFGRSSHVEVAPLPVEFQRLTALRLLPDGRLLAADHDAREIRVVTPAGEVAATWKPGFAPEALAIAPDDGTIYAGGEGRLAHLGADGTPLLEKPMPEDMAPEVSHRRKASGHPPRISGMAVSARDVFIAFGSGWSTGSKSRLFRVDRGLEQPKVLAEELRGCCQRCDIVAVGGDVVVAENAVHRVVRYDREGKRLAKWGERGRTGLAGFGSCCNPMNLCLDAAGRLYTAESGMARVKCYSLEGELEGLVGYVGVQRFRRAGRMASSCSNIAIAATADARRVYVMDYKNNRIRVLERYD